MAHVSVIGFSISPDAHRSDLRPAAVDEQFDAGDEAGVIGRQKQHCLGNILTAQRSNESLRTDRFIMSREDAAVKRY
jgi:hypothetical protein